MEFRILGPLEVVEDDRPLQLGRGRERALLALLLLRANEVVSTDLLIEDLWHDSPPATAPKALQVYVSRLRKHLGADVLVTRSPGYALEVRPEQFDLARFELLVEAARHAGPVETASKLRDALALWRGPPLAEFAYQPFAQAEIARLEELHMTVLEDRIAADLALGRHAELVGELELLVSRNPMRERLRLQLMLALYRSGRQAEALDEYQAARRTLTEELGLEPSAEMKKLERRILAHDPALDLPPPPEETVGTGAPDATSQRLSRRKRAKLVAALVVVLLVAAGVATVAVARSGSSPPEAVVATPSSVAVIDPSTNRVVAAIPVGDRPTQIAAFEDAIWVLHPDIRTLSLLSRSERKVLRTVGVGGAPSGLAVDENGVWVGDARSASVTLIEPEGLTVAGMVRTRETPLVVTPFENAGHLALGFGSLWFASGERTITRIDPASGRVLKRISDVDAIGSLGGIAIGAGSVWVAGPLQESMVTRIDPRRNVVAAKIFFQKFRLNGIVVGGAGVWTSDVGSDQVWLIDSVLNEPVGTTQVGAAPLSVAYAAGSIWVANSGDGTVSRIDATSGRISRTISVGGSPNGIAATDDGIWVTVD